MMFTTEMIQLFAVVLGKDSGAVTESLLREGCMEFVKTSELADESPKDISAVEPAVALADVSDLRKRIEGFLHTGGIIPAAPRESDLNSRVDVNVQEENNHLDRITAERAALRERQRGIHQEILKLEDLRRQVELYGMDFSGMKLPSKNSLISMQIGKIPASNVKRLENGLKDLLSLSVPIGVEGETAHQLLIFMKRDSQAINRVLSHAGWANVELPSEVRSVNKDVFGELSSKLKSLNAEQKKLEDKASDVVKREASRLRETWTNLRVNELLCRIQDNFKSSSRTIIFTGWLPSSKKETLTEEITEACRGRCYLEWNQVGSSDVIGDEVPVEFDNPSLLAPFQMLVSNFGVPQYGTIDPTPFVMPLYLAMFGLMFADVGQGVVLAILGFLGARCFGKDDQKRGLYNLSWLIVWCGISSIFFGILFGSYFGAGLFKPVWFDFHGIVAGHSDGGSVISSIYDILSITIYFGISVIAIGLVFNWINLIRTGKMLELLFDKGGVLGGWIYGAGIYAAFYFVRHDYKEFPSANILFVLIGLPCLLLFIKEPYHYVKHRSVESGKFNPLIILNWLLEWMVELLEIFSGYLSNTLSFMRVAGLGIAHVCLMISFFTLASMTSGIWSVIILILGNILVIGLEGLSAGIQALRLSYYEFFTKFFHGSGKLYTPISLNSTYK